MPKEVIILGCGPTHVECKYHCETWGVNGTYTIAKRLDKLFMTDEPSEVDACWYDMARVLKTDTTLVFPIEYDRFKDLGLPIEIYPIDKIIGRFRTRFFSNTIAYMLAYALYYDYEKIWMFGIDMMTSGSYIQEKGGVEFWMGIAAGMSTERLSQGKSPIEIFNTRGSATGKTWNGKMYGYYGLQEEEMLKEHLMAPWDIVRVSKTSDPQDEWIKDPVADEYKLVKTHTVAGEEIVVA